jgi:hypothetical protein
MAPTHSVLTPIKRLLVTVLPGYPGVKGSVHVPNRIGSSSDFDTWSFDRACPYSREMPTAEQIWQFEHNSVEKCPRSSEYGTQFSPGLIPVWTCRVEVPKTLKVFPSLFGRWAPTHSVRTLQVHVLRVRGRHHPTTPHGGHSPIHQTSVCFTSLTLGPCAMQSWSRYRLNFKGSKPL